MASAPFLFTSVVRLKLSQAIRQTACRNVAALSSPSSPTLSHRQGRRGWIATRLYSTALRPDNKYHWLRRPSAVHRWTVGRVRCLVSSSAEKNPLPYVKDFDLDSTQVEFYRQNGFVVVPNVLSDTHLDVWRDVIDNAVARRGPDWVFPKKGQADATNVELEFYTKVFTQRVNLWQTDTRARDLLLSAAKVLVRAACHLEGISALRLWHDQALYKEPWANATSWHLDVPYWSFDSEHAMSIWVALDDATLANGCMHFIPGSHKLAREEYRQDGFFKEIKIGKNMADVFKSFPGAQSMESVAVPMTAGSVSFHSGMLIHGAGCNMTPRRRRAMTLQLMPDGSRFNGNQNILTDEQVAALMIGEVMNDETQNPLLFAETTCT